MCHRQKRQKSRRHATCVTGNQSVKAVCCCSDNSPDESYDNMEGNTTLYSVSAIEGKGLGCVAETKIRKGTLILKEIPCFHHDCGDSVDKEFFDDLFHGYGTLSAEQKEKYLSLSNCFSNGNVSHSSASKLNKLQIYLEENPINLPVEEARLVYQISHTNSFYNGVCLEMSKFNHSCIPNAEYFWNEDTKTRDLRAIKKIEKGAEITVNYMYIGTSIYTRDERRNYLFENYNFHCNCIGCDLTEEELNTQDKMCQEYRTIVAHKEDQKRLKKLMNNFDTSSEVDDLKSLYKLAKDLKIVKHWIILQVIVEGFDAACQGYLTTALKTKRDSFKKNITSFANAGYCISFHVRGPEHSITKSWQKRKEDPVGFFKSEHGNN